MTWTVENWDTEAVLVAPCGRRVHVTMIADAEWLAGVLNGPVPISDAASPALAWSIARNGRLLHLAFPGRPDHVALLPNEREARVLITEVQDA